MYSYQLSGRGTCETGFLVCSLTFCVQSHVYYIYTVWGYFRDTNCYNSGV